MIKTFTKNELVKFLYQEHNEQHTEIENARLTDIELAEEINSLNDVRKHVDQFRVKPSSRVIESILNYSKQYNAVK